MISVDFEKTQKTDSNSFFSSNFSVSPIILPQPVSPHQSCSLSSSTHRHAFFDASNREVHDRPDGLRAVQLIIRDLQLAKRITFFPLEVNNDLITI